MSKAKTTIDNIHAQRKRKNVLTALLIVTVFGAIAAMSIIYNIMVR